MEVTMTSQDLSTSGLARGVAIRVLIGTALTAVLVVVLIGPQNLGFVAQMGSNSHLHAPRWELLAQASLAIKIHLATVLAALTLATIQMIGPKGRTLHRVLGWTLAVLLVTTSIAAMFIRNPQGGLFNPFQIFVVTTLITVPLGIWAARRHNVRRHAGMMSGLYFGALIIAGSLAFMPGRLMWRMFFG